MGCNTPPMPPEPERPGQRKVFCVKFQREMPGLDEPPFDAELGKRIYENVSEEAWKSTWRISSSARAPPFHRGTSPRAARPNFRFLCPI